METDYKKLFQKILPKITFSYPEPDGIIYEVDYKNIMITDRTISLLVDYSRITPKNKVTVVPRVLNETLHNDIKLISRYINIERKMLIIENTNTELI